MANFVKSWDNRYWTIASIHQTYVGIWPSQDNEGTPADDKWWIYVDGQPIRGQTNSSGWSTQAAAQAALDTAIVTLGGSV